MTSAQACLVLQHIRRLAGTQRAAQPPDEQLLERFTGKRDEAAFATLVRRHGPMVLNVCRSVLHHEQDAEDAFQATFLVLARKADSIRQRQAVAGWLYEVAHHVAVKAQAAAARRQARERRAASMTHADPTLDMTLRDLQRVLHEELRRLPDKYRLPLVLCYLEGRSHEEAAGQLGWSKGTFRGRLDRGRAHLRRRLASRGVALSALLCAIAVAPKAAAQPLVDSVVRAAVLSAVDGAAVAGFSARVSALAEGVTQAMLTSKLKVATAVLLAVGLVAGAGALGRQALAARGNADPPAVKSPAAKPQAAPKPAAQDKDSITYGGRVLGPDGQPIAEAKLYLTPAWGYLREPYSAPALATTGPDGRFEFKVSNAKFGDQATVVAAAAANHGVGWIEVPVGHAKGDITLQLVDDDVAITGQIVDLEAKPIRGANLRVLQINAAAGEDLGPWLEAAKGKKGLSLELEKQHLSRFTIALSPQVTTDAEGRFRLAGIGRNRLVFAQLEGPTIFSQQLQILTRPGKSIEVPDNKGNPEYGEPRTVATYYGASFRHVAAPTKPIVGVVRDKETKKPLAGITIRSYTLATNAIHLVDNIRTTTDAQGRYRLTGMPKGEGNKIVAVPGSEQPYVVCSKAVANSPGLEPVTVDFELKRGVWIEGKITDKVTGKPLQAAVEYFSLYSNPNLRDYDGFDSAVVFRSSPANEDGSYRVVGLPGPGLLAVFRMDHYLRAAERDDEEGVNENFLKKGTAPYWLLPLSNYSALARIEPAKGVDPVKRNVTLDPGWTFTGRVIGPDGKSLIGARGFGLGEGVPLSDREGMKTAEFRVWGFNPRHPRDVFLQHLEKRLIGVVQAPKENGGSVIVRMVPGATVTGRLVEPDGRARAGVELDLQFRKKDGTWGGYSPESIKTDREGRFRLEALVPGYEFRLTADKGAQEFGRSLRPGETMDVGDWSFRPPKE